MATIPTAPVTEAREIWTVSQLTRRVKGILETQIGAVWVAGEISNWRVSPAGHAYFTLKDEGSQLRAVIFRGRLSQVKFEVENGLEVFVHGGVSVYEQRGEYQIICEEMQPRGMGALQLAFEKLKAKLEAEGLFDPARKKPLPLLPKRIGIVTSPSGAAIRDILNVIQRRFAHVHILLYPARVQGEGASAEIVEGIRALDAYGVDVMIVGRGGGSLEDLWSFNEEAVVRAIAGAKTPIISAVGHETDFTLADFAADVRAPTPSAAAELVVREQEALAEAISNYQRRLQRTLDARMAQLRGRLERMYGSFVFRRPEELLRQLRQRCDDARMTIDRVLRHRILDERYGVEKSVRALALLSPGAQVRRAHERLASMRRRLFGAGLVVPVRKRAALRTRAAQLDALSPLAILGRGYAVAWQLPGETLVRRADQLRPGDTVRVRFGEGSAETTVQKLTDG
jgi:exodeoxyribonuclease VII large subunit